MPIATRINMQVPIAAAALDTCFDQKGSGVAASVTERPSQLNAQLR
jgi:hypothetical protein